MWLATPFPAISKAVPWSGEVRTKGSPPVTFIPLPNANVLNPTNPYAASKAAADLLIQSVYSVYSISRKDIFKLAICRAGNVIGGGDWS